MQFPHNINFTDFFQKLFPTEKPSTKLMQKLCIKIRTKPGPRNVCMFWEPAIKHYVICTNTETLKQKKISQRRHYEDCFKKLPVKNRGDSNESLTNLGQPWSWPRFWATSSGGPLVSLHWKTDFVRVEKDKIKKFKNWFCRIFFKWAKNFVLL